MKTTKSSNVGKRPSPVIGPSERKPGQPYWQWTTPDTPKSERSKFNIGDVYQNAAKCGECGDTIRSDHKHDFKRCSCGNIFVDGGSWYVRRGWNKSLPIEDIIPYNDGVV